MTAETASPLPIYTLLCHSDVERAVLCFGSPHARCKDPFRHTVIDDGSLTEGDRDRLLGAFEGLTILSRAEQDERVVPLLKGRPNCLKYRTEHAFALKLIDPPLMAGGALARLRRRYLLYPRLPGAGPPGRAGQGSGLHEGLDLGLLGPVPQAGLRQGSPAAGPEPQRGPDLRGAVDVRPRLHRVVPRPGGFPCRDLPPGADRLGGAGGSQAVVLLRPRPGRLPDPGPAILPRLVALHFIRVLRDLLDVPGYMADLERAEKADPGRVAELLARPATVDGLLMGSLTRLRRLASPDRPPWHEPEGSAHR